jgi:hypothetical protein
MDVPEKGPFVRYYENTSSVVGRSAAGIPAADEGRISPIQMRFYSLPSALDLVRL